ncbi:hypothetical protein [Brasilonema octagenarum]|uniref:hypothetical protein n=2 Tax=Brasilonema TaxID=383614 RepID=UPI00145D2B15|nr:hypothetical protein [Brasilonema octagenarum]
MSQEIYFLADKNYGARSELPNLIPKLHPFLGHQNPGTEPLLDEVLEAQLFQAISYQEK